jgi:CheY-like chemotaxis protein
VSDRPARILLVDDEQSIQTLLSYPLRKEGYNVVQATDGRQALDRFEEQPFNLCCRRRVATLNLPFVVVHVAVGTAEHHPVGLIAG